MKKIIKKYNDFVKENVEPVVKPKTTPKTTPKRRIRKSPIRRDKPGIEIKPKATEKDVVNKLLKLAKNNEKFQKLFKNKYE